VILLDTAPLVALCDPRDSLNAVAVSDLARASRHPLVTCAAVMTEACALLPHRMQRQRLHRFIEDFSVTAYTPQDERRLWGEVFEWLEQYEEHDPDWADGYLAVVSGHERRARVWTYDREFRTVWRRPDGSRIPLVVS
jgi:predicted nucleic acid-binding protein